MASTARLSTSLADALVAANATGHKVPTLYRGGRDLECHTVSKATLYALADRGLVELVVAQVERRSRAGLVYKGMWPHLDAGRLTAKGIAARAAILAERAANR